jgi:hypothetical protein
VPHALVGKYVVVRIDAATITVYDEFSVVARHERMRGRGQTVTDREHYPPHKRKATSTPIRPRFLRRYLSSSKRARHDVFVKLRRRLRRETLRRAQGDGDVDYRRR